MLNMMEKYANLRQCGSGFWWGRVFFPEVISVLGNPECAGHYLLDIGRQMT
jgi:hypothetical protein